MQTKYVLVSDEHIANARAWRRRKTTLTARAMQWVAFTAICWRRAGPSNALP